MKKIAPAILALVLMLSLTACSRTFTCGICLEEKNGKQYVNQFLEEEIVICPDCYNEMKQLATMFGQ